MPPDQTVDAGTTQTPAAAPVTPAADPAAASPAASAAAPAPAADSSLLGSDSAADSGTPNADGTAAAPTPASNPATPQGAPETYEFKTLDGAALNAASVAEFSVIAKELGLPQDAAQKLIDTLTPSFQERGKQSIADAVATYRADLVTQVKADKELGGDKLDANLAIAKKARDAFGTPALRTLLNQSGLGDHPEVIRMFYKVGQAISEDKLVTGGTKPTKGEVDAATRLYGGKP